jgi:2-deoxy-D-gluconate 3-dehydrogenase
MNAHLFSLEGKVALITGGNGGLGHAIALAYQDAGARVVVTGRDPEKNRAAGAGLELLPLDVRDEREVEAVVHAVVARFGRLDVLVNNAGIFRAHSVLELPEEGWDEVLDSNLKGAFLCAKHAARAMIKAGNGGKIINVGSMYSMFGHPASIGYSASKAGLLGLTRSLAAELGPRGIQVNALLPGWFTTDMNAGLPGSPRGDEIRRRTPAGRWGDGRDLAGAAIFLASRASDFVTGAEIAVDGGYHVSDRAIHPA